VKRRPVTFLAIAIACTFALATALAAAQEHGGTTRNNGGRGFPPAGGLRQGAPPGAHEGDSEHDSAATEEGHGEHGPAPLNAADIFDKKRPALLAILINFGLLVGLYYTLGKKPIAEALRQRRITIGKDIEDAQKMLAEAEERAKKYQADLKNADVDAATTKTALVAAGKGEVEQLLEEAQEKAERMKRDAERLVEQEKKQVYDDLHRETVDLAVVQAMKVLEKAVTPEDHARFAQDLLTELAARPNARGGSVAPRGAS
jgi:F-type H+-transporting ATPase subunit b